MWGWKYIAIFELYITPVYCFLQFLHLCEQYQLFKNKKPHRFSKTYIIFKISAHCELTLSCVIKIWSCWIDTIKRLARFYFINILSQKSLNTYLVYTIKILKKVVIIYLQYFLFGVLVFLKKKSNLNKCNFHFPHLGEYFSMCLFKRLSSMNIPC